MSLAITYCRSNKGINAPLVSVETHISGGLPAFTLLGLPEAAVKESKERIRVAFKNTRFTFPNERITVNLAPVGLRKGGGRFDLAIAIGILAASGQIPKDDLHHFEFAGELGLTGSLRPITTALPFALATQKAKRGLFISDANQDEVSLVDDLRIYPANHLLQVCAHLCGDRRILEATWTPPITLETPAVDLSEVHGQHHAKKALEIAAAGGHNLLMIGPPGTGKTMISQCLPGIMQPLTQHQALRVAAIQSVSNLPIDTTHWCIPPFRSPHHSCSDIALVGGGSPLRPGEISRAHHGVLFLDELPEYPRSALEALREPMESGEIYIARAKQQETFPAQFQLVATMNPCPCGYVNSKVRDCRCTPDQILRYQNKISGPLLDRIDLHVQVPALPKGVLTQKSTQAETSHEVKQRVKQAQIKQLQRQQILNRQLSGKQLHKYCDLGPEERELLETAMDKLKLSTRSYQNTLRVARTLADLANHETVSTIHLSEAFSFRSFDKGLPS